MGEYDAKALCLVTQLVPLKMRNVPQNFTAMHSLSLGPSTKSPNFSKINHVRDTLRVAGGKRDQTMVPRATM